MTASGSEPDAHACLLERRPGHKMPSMPDKIRPTRTGVPPQGTFPCVTLIFDFDGTIADTLSAIIRLVNEHAKEFNIKPLADTDVDELRGMSNLEIIKKYKVPLVKVPYLVLRAQKELNQRIGEMSLFPGVKELVLDLKRRGIRMGILTSNSRENVQKFLRAQVLDVFDFIHAEQNFFGKNWPSSTS